LFCSPTPPPFFFSSSSSFLCLSRMYACKIHLAWSVIDLTECAVSQFRSN
jgi:hypothetical protein